MYQNMRSICEYLTPKKFALLTPIICLSFNSYSNAQIFAAEHGDGHNMPHGWPRGSKCNVSIYCNSVTCGD